MGQKYAGAINTIITRKLKRMLRPKPSKDLFQSSLGDTLSTRSLGASATNSSRNSLEICSVQNFEPC